MDRLELALRRYQQIVPKAAQHWDVPLRALQVWLDEDVNAVLDHYTRRPTFREQASWSIRNLRPNAGTSERTLVDRIDAELVRCAKAVRKLTRYKILRRKMFELFPPKPVIVSEVVEITSQGVEPIHAEQGLVDETESELSRVEAIAQRWWSDLVNINDYFEPEQEFVQDESGRYVQRGEWIVSLNPELLPVGNFVVRCLLKRVSLLNADLASIIQKSHSALEQVRPRYGKDRAEVEASWGTLSQLVQELNTVLRTGPEIRLRDACVVATQIYAAFHPRPDLAWLGLDNTLLERAGSTLEARTRQSESAEMFDRIATALDDLRYLHEGDDPRRPEIEDAIASGGLVIVEASREAHWEERSLEKLPEGSWRFLVALARKARLRAAVDFRDVFGNDALTDSAMSTAWGRLKGRLPGSLWRLVEPGERPRTYRLNLDSHLIYFF